MKLSGLCFFRISGKNFCSNRVLVNVIVLECKGLLESKIGRTLGKLGRGCTGVMVILGIVS